MRTAPFDIALSHPLSPLRRSKTKNPNDKQNLIQFAACIDIDCVLTWVFSLLTVPCICISIIRNDDDAIR